MIDPPRHGARVRTLIPTYGGPQKQQIANLKRIPTGTEGVVRWVGRDTDTSVWVLVIFWIDGKKHFAKLAPSIIEPIVEGEDASSQERQHEPGQ